MLLGFNNACFVLSSSVVSPAGGWLGDAMEPMIKETIVFPWQDALTDTYYILLYLTYIPLKVALE